VTINVALVASGVFGDLLVGVLERDSEFRVVARAEDLISVVRLGEDAGFDAIVLCAPTGSMPLATERLMASGACGVMVTVSPEGKAAWIHRRHHVPRELRDVAPGELRAAIRAAVVASGETSDG
jgi:hypothetical protein